LYFYGLAWQQVTASPIFSNTAISAFDCMITTFLFGYFATTPYFISGDLNSHVQARNSAQQIPG